jgi:hypothetical protein
VRAAAAAACASHTLLLAPSFAAAAMLTCTSRSRALGADALTCGAAFSCPLALAHAVLSSVPRVLRPWSRSAYLGALWCCRTRLPRGALGQRAGTFLGRRHGRALRWNAFGEDTCIGGGCVGLSAEARGAVCCCCFSCCSACLRWGNKGNIWFWHHWLLSLPLGHHYSNPSPRLIT